MCGIAGFIGKGSHNDLQRMIASIKYRGPDYQGVFRDGNAGLAHARLSIIDLSPAGNQPMFNQDKSIAIVFNGEIYNFQELKKNLIAKGYEFKSKTDTEAIIYLYEEFGEKCFEKLNGMFAIAIWDSRKKRLILARDRMGKKPLYWGIFDGTLIFGSELKALTRHPLCQKELSLESLNKYLLYEYIPTPWSIFKNIYKLEPATFLVWQNGRARKEKFWEMDFAANKNISFKEALRQLDEKIEESVKARLVSDVPLGLFLSGGLDSSTIAYYAQKNSRQKMKTFSIGFEEKSFDESDYAQKVADYLGTEHHNKILTSRDALDLIPRVADLIDEPFADASLIPTYLLSRFTKERATAALSGDGGDELFAGYPTFQAQHLAEIYERIPLFLRKYFIEKIIFCLPVSFKNISFDFKAKKFIDGFYGEPQYRYQRWLGSFNKDEAKYLLKENIRTALENKNEFEDIDNYLKEARINNPHNQLLYLYLRTYMMDDILAKVDRASMFNSLEVRAPLTNYKLVDFVNSLPYHFKYKGFTTKYILKKLMADKLPREVVYRKKKGFGIPLGRWFSGELKGFCEQVLSENNIKRGGIFNYSYISRIKQEHFSGKKDNRKKLWTLIVFQLWHKKWIN